MYDINELINNKHPESTSEYLVYAYAEELVHDRSSKGIWSIL